MKDMTIGAVAQRSGLAASTLRYYEKMDIVPKPYRLNGRRLYDEKWMNNLGFTMLALDAGFSIAELRNMLADQTSHEPLGLLKNMADDKITELDEKIKQIEQMKSLLNMVSSCGCGSLEKCGELALKKMDCIPV